MEKDLAILMADLTGYTAMTDVHGGASAAKMVSKYMEIVDASIVGTTSVVQRIGDQVVMIAEEPNDLLKTAERLNILTLQENHFLSIHAGLHFGNTLIDNTNLFGSTINITSRIMNIASRGQILCSSDFLNQLPSDSQQLFKSIGFHKLKNLMNTIEVFVLENKLMEMVQIDPVCHMQVDPLKQNPFILFNGINYHFCSEHCKSLFITSPDHFIDHRQ